MWKLIALLVVLLLLVSVGVLRWHFHLSWLWATAPIWGAIILTMVVLLLAVAAIFSEGLAVD